jgi:hypothetical protein
MRERPTSRKARLGRLLLLEEVLLEKNDASGWTGFTSLSGVVEQGKTRRLGRSEPVTSSLLR